MNSSTRKRLYSHPDTLAMQTLFMRKSMQNCWRQAFKSFKKSWGKLLLTLSAAFA